MSRAEFLRLAHRLGWRHEQRQSGHLRLTKPGYRPVTASMTPSDPYAYLAALRDLRKAERINR
jgi:hypothetical protein